MKPRRRVRRDALAVAVVSVLAVSGAAVAPGVATADDAGAGVSFREIALPGTSLGGYVRASSPEQAIRDANLKRPIVTLQDFAQEPIHSRGIAGVVLLDYDGDHDLDMYVTNGPGRANSLFQNRLRRDHQVNFVDVAQSAGAALTDVDSNGACAGDVDNDGDTDLYVLGRHASNHLLRNDGNGTFADITASSGAGAGTLSHPSCTMADFDSDGLLDIAIANSFDMHKALAIVAVPYALNQRNQLLHNVDGRRFTDVSDSSGFTNTVVKEPPPGDTAPFADPSWAIAAVDYDQDGDADIMVGNDQGAIPMKKYGGIDRGFIRTYQNDGHGRFTDVTYDIGMEPGAWMGMSYGDFNFDGTLDVFGTNGGDYMMIPLAGVQNQLGDLSSRWLLQRPDGTFADPRRSSIQEPAKNGADPDLGGLGATPWGWGTSAFDYDNDGATDILYQGGLDAVFFGATADNPAALLRNKGPQALRKGFYPSFEYDPAISDAGADERRRLVVGVAAGDLNRDGFTDVVSVAQSRKVGDLTRYGDVKPFDYDSPFDQGASYLQVYAPIPENPGTFRPTGNHTEPGSLSVKLNSGNGNLSATVRTRGSVGVTTGGSVNRDGVGAVVKFTPHNGLTAIRPVMAGSSMSSQDALDGVFGMGRARTGTVEVLWPGGVRNKLYGVQAGKQVDFPEIPCSFADTSMSVQTYTACVQRSLRELVAAGQLSRTEQGRFFASAVQAYHEAHHTS
ncbi:CRTAC1 family protein [Micromonospora sp. NPDC050495]|uniref:CRTAC1 family protein n=1 Tax=Micromonospora sp. NPDC050495 TaxID=3154936 RepID=UPI00340D2358